MLPLSGLRIIAVEQYGAGPFGSMMLADLGAEVIKIENRVEGGDVEPLGRARISSPTATAISSRPSTATREV